MTGASTIKAWKAQSSTSDILSGWGIEVTLHYGCTVNLAANTQLGSYEILSRLGAGGMAEVWRARDSRLGRDVAIKVLAEAFAQNEERLARFKREAQACSKARPS